VIADVEADATAEVEDLTLADGPVGAPSDGDEHATRREAMSSASAPIRAMPPLAQRRSSAFATLPMTGKPIKWFRKMKP
jgi:hypothetical protein